MEVATTLNLGVVSQGLVEAQEGDDTIKVTGTGVTSASLKAGVGDDLMSITGGITDGSLFGGTGNDSFDFSGGRATGLIDTGSGVDSILLGTSGDSITLTGALTSTSVNAGAGNDSLVISANLSAASIEGGSGDDTLNLTAGSSLLATTIKGGAGADKISLYGANDVVFDVVSRDDVIGGTGADTLLFTGSVLKSVIQAGSGNDSIVMSGTGMTANTIDLGVGTDTLKFTKETNADTVTLTSTTITGAKSITYEKAATAAVITTGAGADAVIFEAALAGAGPIETNSGNDSIQFLKSAAFTGGGANLGAGADSVYGADVISNSTISGGAGKDTFMISTLSNAAIYGGSDIDSVNITGSLYGATVDFVLVKLFSSQLALLIPQSLVLVTTPSLLVRICRQLPRLMVA